MSATILCTRCIGRTSPRRALLSAARLYSTPADGPIDTPLTPGPIKSSPDIKDAIKSSVPAGQRLDRINYFKNKPDPVAMDDHEYPSWLWTLLSDSKKSANKPEEIGDLYSKSKKTRSLAKRLATRQAQFDMLNPEKKVPINEHTVDLPFATVSDPNYGPDTRAPMTRVVAVVGGVGEGLGSEILNRGQKIKVKQTTVAIGSEGELQVTQEEAAKAWQELKKEMRKRGRANIKEGNFLAQM